ncbi:hypothetical protein [Chryseobacterium wangxinyae]|uniref:hypothetical protein n=1 Tax=Chryseobacterium sp. CY353 TaxID=2997334 RepID=UPI00226DC6C4|nr:hypothetical protein [Chryseobacterium sp. CY353]
MKHKYAYAILVLIILSLMLFANNLIDKNRDLQMVLDQCSERYYKEIGVVK